MDGLSHPRPSSSSSAELKRCTQGQRKSEKASSAAAAAAAAVNSSAASRSPAKVASSAASALLSTRTGQFKRRSGVSPTGRIRARD